MDDSKGSTLTLPCESTSDWAFVEQVLCKPVTDLTNLDAMLTAFSSLDATPRTCTFFATIPGSEAAGSFDFDAFLAHGVPLLLEVALAMPSLFAGVTVPILRTYSACGDGLTRKSLTLTRRQCACLLAHSFLGSLILAVATRASAFASLPGAREEESIETRYVGVLGDAGAQ